MDNSLNQLDTAYGGMLTLSVTGGTTVLTTAQASNPIIYVTGTLSANQVIAFPATVAGRRLIIPACTMGNFALWVVGNAGADQTGVYFWIQFGIPYGVVVTPSRVYWDYGAVDVGTIVDKANGYAGNGWLPCDGRFVSMLQHDLLWGIIGGTYGVSGTYPTGAFKLPDLRGTVTAMADQIGTIPPAGPFAVNAGNRGILLNWGVNTFGGEAAHVLALAEIPYHNHPDAGHGHPLSDPSHTHPLTLPGSFGFGIGSIAPPSPLISQGAQGLTTGASGTGITIGTGYANIQPAGGSGAHNNIQPTTTTMKMIKW